jgi:Haem-binding domain
MNTNILILNGDFQKRFSPMKRIFKIVLIVFVLAFAAIQFVRPDRTNPPVVQAQTLDATTDVPPDIKMILGRSCSDCHSNQTLYPWYSNVSPFSWFLADHIRDGRKELNFSEWSTYAPRKKAKKLDELCEQVSSGEMPLPSYLWIHRDAKLTASESQALCDWSAREKSKIIQ